MQAILELQKMEAQQSDVSAFGSSCTSSNNNCCNNEAE